jgi:purine-binding chemotaxis protein CheW
MEENKGKEMVEDDFLDEDDEDTQKDKFLTFRVGEEDYGIEIRHVTEIIGIQKITAVPDMPDFVKGVINLRGKVIPVLDMRRRFVLEDRDYDERTCIVVVNVAEAAVGLVVDTVNEVADIPEEQIEPAPEINKAGSNIMIQGLGKVGEDVKILLDVNKLLYGQGNENFKGADQVAVS